MKRRCKSTNSSYCSIMILLFVDAMMKRHVIEVGILDSFMPVNMDGYISFCGYMAYTVHG